MSIRSEPNPEPSAAERRARAMVNSALDAIIAIDRRNRITEFNPAAERVFGWSCADVLGRDVREVLIPHEFRERHGRGLARHLATGEVTLLDQRIELVALRSDGSRFPIELTVTRFGSIEEPIFTAFIRDISQQRILAEQLQRQAQRLTSIVDAQQGLAASDADPEQLLDLVAGMAQTVLAAEGGVLELVEGEELVYRAVSGVAEGQLGRRLGMHSSLSGQALRNDAALWCADCETDDRVDAVACREVGLRSMVVAVLRDADRPIGVVKVLSPKPNRFTESDAHLLELFTASLGAVLHRKRAELDRLRMAETQAAVVALQHEVASSDQGLQSLMELLTLQAQVLTPASGSVVEWIDGDELVLKAASGSLSRQVGMRIRREGSLSGLCVAEGRALICHDSETDSRVDREACRRIGARSLAVMPLRPQDGIIGVLKVISGKPSAFSDTDVRNLQILTETLGQVIGRHNAAEELKRSEEKYRIIFKDNPQPMWVFDRQTLMFLAVNAAAVKQYGYSRQEFLAMGIRDIRPKEEIERLEQQLRDLPERRVNAANWQHRRKNGDLIDVEITSDAIMFDGRPARIVLSHDVTMRLQAEAGRASANRALQMLSACNAAMIRIDDETRLLDAVCRIVVDLGGYRLAGVGYAQDDAERSLKPMAAAGEHPEHVSMMKLSWGADSPDGRGPAGLAVRTGRPVVLADLRADQLDFPWRNAAIKYGYLSAIALPLRSGSESFGFIGLFSDRAREIPREELELLQELANNVAFGISARRAEADRQRIQAELAHKAQHDMVTGLARYSVLQPRLERMLAEAEAMTFVFLLDIDGFKGINESIGHDLADDVLRKVAARLARWSSDSISISHLTGDEFVIVVGGRDEVGALALAEEMRSAIAKPFDDGGYHLLFTATVGISHAPAHGTTPTELLRRAQVAMERGKVLGRDCISFFRTEQMQDIEDRMLLGGKLRTAVGAGELTLHYQPQINAESGRLNGFEALLRWSNVELGPVSPARFIPIAEKLGLMPEIGSWVLREACHQARQWLDAGHAGFVIAINVSAQQLQRPGLVRAVVDSLREFDLPARVLEIELTESSLMENVVRVQGTLAELKALGVMLSLDDFGTGYSSLAYLKNFSLDKLKIDQSFVRGLPENADDAAIARAIVSIGHQLRLLVAAEGVETPAQAGFLRGIGCDELQGYFLGRPQPAQEAERAFLGQVSNFKNDAR